MVMEQRYDCNVVLVGDCKVGKTAIASRFVNTKFSESYRATGACERLSSTAVVANRRVKYTIWDTTGSRSSAHSEARDLAYHEADVFLLCYKISDPTTLFSALNYWCPEVRAVSPSTPIVLVGCQSDTRNARDALSALAKSGKAPVSSEQALSMSQQIGAAVYVETSARASVRTAQSAFEVAALAAMGKLPTGKATATPPTTPPTTFSSKKQRFSSVSPGDSLEREDRFWDYQNRHSQGTTRLARTTSEHARKTGSLGSSRSGGSLSSKTRSSISIPSISSSTGSTSKTPKGSRKSSNASNGDRMITIKCGTLNEDKTYEEIEVEVPAPIYDTMQLYNETSAASSADLARGAKGRRSLGSKLRNLFTSNKS